MRLGPGVTSVPCVVSMVATFGISTIVAFACRIPELYPGRCNPSSARPCPKDENDYLCCSDDPAALDLADLDAAALPAYDGRGGDDTPLFSDARNEASDHGMCIRSGSVAPAFALFGGCPVPCNPNWDEAAVDAICGDGTFCCQTVELESSDCVFDAGLGDAGCWRPVRGDDIEGLGGLDLTTWAPGVHATHQDAGGLECQAFVVALTDAELAAAGGSAEDVLQACLRRLGVANQRGYCIGGPGVVGCPLAQPTYRDACEQLNDAQLMTGCG
jgi:hypothetical protein